MMRFKLRELRKAAGMSQADIARAAGVDLATAGNWDRGVTLPKADALFLICSALHTEPNEILGWYDDHPDGRPDATADASERALLDNYRACAPSRSTRCPGWPATSAPSQTRRVALLLRLIARCCRRLGRNHVPDRTGGMQWRSRAGGSWRPWVEWR